MIAVSSLHLTERQALEDQELVDWLHATLRSGQAWSLVKGRHLTETAVADIIGTTQASIWGYLNGRTFPQRSTALRLARLLETLENDSPAPAGAGGPPSPPGSAGLSHIDRAPSRERAALQAAYDLLSLSPAEMAEWDGPRTREAREAGRRVIYARLHELEPDLYPKDRT